jgi:hypothetical protein
MMAFMGQGTVRHFLRYSGVHNVHDLYSMLYGSNIRNPCHVRRRPLGHDMHDTRQRHRHSVERRIDVVHRPPQQRPP